MSLNKEPYLDMIFGNDGSLGSDQFFNRNEDEVELELDSNPNLTLEILHTAFVEFRLSLSKYNHFQLANGLDYIFSPSLSNLSFALKHKQLDLQKRVATIEALSDFMLHVFEKNAEPILGHLSQSVQDKANSGLNHICYMFWDVAPIPYKCEDEISQACLDVMGKCAQSKNIAVVEGALHGLGHAQLYLDGPKLQGYIDNARIEEGLFFESLTTYACNARKGRIQ